MVMIRPEKLEDYRAIYDVNLQAFKQENEPRLVEDIRRFLHAGTNASARYQPKKICTRPFLQGHVKTSGDGKYYLDTSSAASKWPAIKPLLDAAVEDVLNKFWYKTPSSFGL